VRLHTFLQDMLVWAYPAWYASLLLDPDCNPFSLSL
jgi:hypothetical protein